MTRKIGMVLIVIGLLFAGWNGYKWLSETASGQQEISETDIVKTDDVSPVAVPTEERIEEKTVPEQVEKPLEPKLRTYEEYKRGDDIGWLLIPSLDKKYPVYWGTDEDTLTQGVGYHVSKFTLPPDGQRHTVLSGHRDTVFRELGELKEGDSLFIQFEEKQYEYQLTKSWITAAEDRTVIVSKDEAVLTLTTCYPFTFLGAAPDRYIIEAPLVNVTEMNL
ncbi:class D sortase [Planococcus versutus]|uniref:Class D sortase n=1 Tax=Planococcus versutus TaxID=1302659 RepID=A0A1B1S317_9BACL|nr:class D sortase [Planococcus versutus]ANU27581.1 class D sortase [Planococcus versutus]